MFDLTNLKPRQIEFPLVSVVIPCYNVEQYIDQCLNSVLNNGYPNVEVICVDDHSTDKTVEHIQNLMKSHSNIQLYDNGADHNIYGGACRNIGMKHAKGKYIYFCDSDDYVLPGLFWRCVERCESLNAEIVFFQFKNLRNRSDFGNVRGVHFDKLIDGSSQTFDYLGTKNIITMGEVVGWNKFYRKSFIDRIQNKWQETKNSNDQFFTLNAAIHAERVVAIEDAFYVHRDDSKTSVQRDRSKGNGLRDLLVAFRNTHDSVEKMGSSELTRQWAEYVAGELNYMRWHKVRVDSGFLSEIRSLLSGWGEFKGEVKEAFEHLDSASPNGGEYDVIVSFATYSKRFNDDHIYEFLDGIVNQRTSLNYHIVANMWAQDYQNLPQKLRDYFNKHNIEVLVSDFNWKPHLKYIMSMKKYGNIPVITVDDDVVYGDDMVQLLYDDHKRHPRTIICGRARRIDRNESGDIISYRNWADVLNPEEQSSDIMPIGIGGVLYPPQFCRLIDDSVAKDVLDKDLLIRDDFYLHYLAGTNCIPTRVVSTSRKHQRHVGFLVDGKIDELAESDDALWRVNSFNPEGNDKSRWLFNTSQKNQPLVFATVNAGTNSFTNITVKSILKYHPSAKVFIIDVFPERKFHQIDDDVLKNIEVIEGITKDRLNLPVIDINDTNLTWREKQIVLERMEINPVPVYFSGDTHHSTNIQFALDTIDHDFVLIDSDAPLIHPVDFVDSSKTTIASISKYCIGDGTDILNTQNIRFEPYIQYFNVGRIKKGELWFFRNERLKDYINLAARWKPNPFYGDEMTSTNWTFLWLTGNLFYRQMLDSGSPYSTIDFRKYVDHFRNGTWNHRKDGGLKERFYDKYSSLFENRYLLKGN